MLVFEVQTGRDGEVCAAADSRGRDVFLQPGRAGEINFDPHSPEKPTDREGRHIMRW